MVQTCVRNRRCAQHPNDDGGQPGRLRRRHRRSQLFFLTTIRDAGGCTIYGSLLRLLVYWRAVNVRVSVSFFLLAMDARFAIRLVVLIFNFLFFLGRKNCGKVSWGGVNTILWLVVFMRTWYNHATSCVNTKSKVSWLVNLSGLYSRVEWCALVPLIIFYIATHKCTAFHKTLVLNLMWVLWSM